MIIKTKDIENTIKDKTTDFFISWNDTPTMRHLLKFLDDNNFKWLTLTQYNLRNCSKLKQQIYNDFYKFYHGNSQILIHIFYNDINDKFEIQFSNITNAKTYPQYKKLKIYRYFGGWNNDFN